MRLQMLDFEFSTAVGSLVCPTVLIPLYHWPFVPIQSSNSSAREGREQGECIKLEFGIAIYLLRRHTLHGNVTPRPDNSDPVTLIDVELRLR